MNLTIATFNLKHDYIVWLSTHWSKRRIAVQQFFQQETPDIVGTQELTKAMIEELLELIPEYDWIGQGRGGGEKGEYCAILYRKDRFRCIRKDTFWLARDEKKKGKRDWLAVLPRICTWGLFEEVGTGEKMLLYNTHLDHVSPVARRNGLALIGNHIRRQNGAIPCILTGDFNAMPGSGALKYLENLDVQYGLFSGNSYNLFLNAEGRQRTYHGFRGKTLGKPLDYIFTSKEIDILEAQIVQKKYDNRYPSDHYPILMKITVNEI